MTQSMTNKAALPFQYVVITPAIPANGNQQAQLQMEQDSWFQLYSYSARTNLDLVADIEPNNFVVQIQDNASSRLFSNQPIPQNLIAPRELVLPRFNVVFVPGTNLNFNFTNLTANPLTITFVLNGIKLFSSSGM